MRIEVKLFAAIRESIDDDSFVCEMPPGATVKELRAALVEAHPGVAELVAHSTFAIESKYVIDSVELSEGEEVACIPPVSGG